MLGGGAPPASWTKNIAAHIKSLAPSTLILDGTDGLTTYGGDLGNTGVGLSSVDLVYVLFSALFRCDFPSFRRRAQLLTTLPFPAYTRSEPTTFIRRCSGFWRRTRAG